MLLVAKTVKSIENLNAGIVLVPKCAFLLDKISHAWSKDTGTLQGKKFFLIHQSVTSNDRVPKAIQNMNWIGLRESYLGLAEVSLKYDSDERRAVSFWATTLFFDMNAAKQLQWDAMAYGIPPSDNLTEDNIGAYICIPPALIDTMRRYSSVLKTIPASKIIKPPAKIFDADDYQNILDDIVSDIPFDLPGWEDFCRKKSLTWARTLK